MKNIPRYIFTLILLYFVYQGSMAALVMCLFLITVSIEMLTIISTKKQWKY